MKLTTSSVKEKKTNNYVSTNRRVILLNLSERFSGKYTLHNFNEKGFIKRLDHKKI